MSQKRVYIIGGLIFLLVTAIALWKEVLRVGSFEVTFFDVGQGDAAFILTPQGRQIVIDGGPDNTILEKLARKIPFWDKTIDMVILSHPAQDHVAGLLDVLKKYHVGSIVWNGIQKDTAIYNAWLDALGKEVAQGAAVFFAKAPQRIVLSDEGCPQFFDIIYPFEDIAGKSFKDDNDTSIVAHFVLCGESVLFTGDLTSKGEKKILEHGLRVDSDILKVGHHGSKTSSSEEFVKAVSPNVAVISAGEQNRYGHPHQETLATLEKYDIDIRRTDEEGDISFRFK